MKAISAAFLAYASDVLADTNTGLSGTKIVKYFRAKSVDCDVDVPHTKSPLTDVANKRTAFLENLERFSPAQQFEIIAELVEHEDLVKSERVIKLKQELFERYSFLSKTPGQVNSPLIVETKHWLEKYPAAYKCYNEALDKCKKGVYERNLLDDLRLSLELLLKQIFNNGKSLENQMGDITHYQKQRGMSTEVTNMFQKVLDYYAKYQNAYVKHNDKVNSGEVDFMIDLTSTFMRYLIK